jgi:glycosyltransferase involved in cell wall biosynthesis
MKILQVVGGNLDEGAAKGAFLLHEQLRLEGVQSTLFTNSITDFDKEGVHSTSKRFFAIKKTALIRRLDNFYKLFYENRKELKFSPGIFGINIQKTREFSEADLIHLHWICNGFIDIKYLSGIDKPIVWTLRDMWPFTGGCHYSLDCDKFQTKCGSCPQLGSKRKRDLSTFIQKRKQKAYPDHITYVGISNWMTEQAKKSRLIGDSRVEMIPNNIDLKHFYSSDKDEARNYFNLPSDKPILLFGSHYLKSIYKGYDILFEVLDNMDLDVQILYFGRNDTDELKQLSMDATYLGFLNTTEMRMAYTAADVFISPSRAESFGKTVAESMACGTPVVCFDDTGSADIVDHKTNGYLAQPYSTDDIISGVKYVLNHPDSKALAKNAIEKAKVYDPKDVARKYLDLYSRILAGR